MNSNLKNHLLILILFFSGIFLQCHFKEVPMLQFNAEGKFKIVQFTDIHMKELNVGKRDSVLEMMKTILQDEKPDLVVLTGDIAVSENVEKAWSTVVQPMIDARIPWAATFGNHDREHGRSNEEIMKYLVKLPFNCSKAGPKKVSGTSNYVLEINGSNGKKEKALLYCFDSNAYTEDRKNPELGKYDWVKFDQIKWYRETSEKYTQKNNNIPLPALAFFHIPLPEYQIVQMKETTVGLKEEDVASPKINSGLYNAFYEMKDVMGVFVGHDHEDSYIGILNGICLAYGCKTGLESYGKLEKGARVIELYEDERKFDSWIHTLSNSKVYFVSFPETFN